jgi:hypothetical protein
MSKLEKWWLLAVVITSLIYILCACESNPKDDIITSKNDGSFNAGIVESAANDLLQNNYSINYTNSFSSTDKSVDFEIDVNKEILTSDMPVIEVVPHYLSSADANRVAVALFGETDFYEAEPMLSSNFTKAEIQEKINRWSQYTNETSIYELYGDVGDAADTVSVVKSFIVDYTELYESASDENLHKKCQWQFKKESCYLLSEEELSGLNLENDNDSIQATVKVGDVRYIFNASTRNKKDYKLNNVSVSLYDGLSPNMIDERIFQAKLCRTQEPSEAQISSIKEKAEGILAQMGLGDWLIDECYVNTSYFGSIPEYKVCLNAVLVLEGVKSSRRPQLNNLKSEEVYASNYYISDVKFEFSANGDLVSFKMYSPVDIKEIVNGNARVLSISELMEKATTYLALSDIYTYGFAAVDSIDEEVGCKVSIANIEYGLSRVKVPNTDESYYYVPAITLEGNIEYYGKQSGNVFYFSESTPLLILNCVDGSVIQMSNS